MFVIPGKWLDKHDAEVKTEAITEFVDWFRNARFDCGSTDCLGKITCIECLKEKYLRSLGNDKS